MTSDELMRLRELRDDLEWFSQLDSTKRYWKHYTLNIQSTSNIVESIINREVRNGNQENS